MKSIITRALLVLTISPFLFAFTSGFGGEGFEIYLNDKVFSRQFGNTIDQVKSFSLSQVSANDKLTIKYHHCGQVGKNRVVTIKDGQNRILKEFRYADGTSSVSSMSVPVKDLLALKTSSSSMKLFYTSTELPKGRVLLNIQPGAVIAKR